MNKLKIKSGDQVKVIAGKDSGKTGKVIQAMPAVGRIAVEGVNKMTKHVRPRGGSAGGDKGQKLTLWAPLDVSKVLLVCPKCSKPTRVGYKVMDDGKKTRICKKCGQAI